MLTARPVAFIAQPKVRSISQPQMGLKRCANDDDNSDKENRPDAKRLIGGDADAPTTTQPKERVTLTSEQEAAVKLAVKGQNIFLTGAAGSGKTVTLKEMLRRLNEKYGPGNKNFPNVHVVAPTAFAALPLSGSTTYSYAGWKPDLFRKPLHELLADTNKTTRKGLDVLLSISSRKSVW